MEKEIQKEIDRITKKIISEYHPDLVVLFGSSVTGHYGKDSDIDLLIIKRTKVHPIWRRVKVREIVQTQFPMDVIVLTPDEFLKLKESQSPFLLEIFKNGKILYEKSSKKNQDFFQMVGVR